MPSALRVAARTDVGRLRMHNEDGFLVADLAMPPPPAWVPPRSPGAYAASGVPKPPTPVWGTLASPPGAALAVLDGMGGHASGEAAPRIAADVFAAALTTSPPSGDEAWRHRLVVAMNGASRAIFEAATAGPGVFRGMGAAALLAVVTGDRLHLSGAGDCRAYVLRAQRLTQVTRDDTLRNDYRAMAGPGADLSEVPANVITKALGMRETVDVRAATLALRAGDVILLCTNGLYDHVDEALIARVLSEIEGPSDACLTLVSLANRAGGRDNITVVVARPEGDLRPPGPGDVLTSPNAP